MFDTTSNSCSSQQQLFTTRYSYGSRDQEFVFCCRGRPFAALVSPNLPTPTSSLLDYDFVKGLGLKVTDLQCKKFFFAGNKMRILGRVSTTVQCIQNGRTGSNFHIKGVVVSDLYKLLDTHCVAGNKMQQQIKILLDATEASEDDDDDEDINNVLNNERKCETTQKTEHESSTPALGPQSGQRCRPFSPPPPPSDDGSDYFCCDDICQWPNNCRQHLVLQDELDISSLYQVDVSAIPAHLKGQLNPTIASTTSPSMAYAMTADKADYWVRVISSAPEIMPPSSPDTKMFSVVGYDYVAKTNIPPAPGTCSRPSSLYNLNHADPDDYKFWSQFVSSSESQLLTKSQRDGKPRVINVKVVDGKNDMLRIGVWTSLPDASDYSDRHVHLATLRRAAPDRVCQACYYMVQHSCPLSTVQKHCASCCDNLKLWAKASDRRKKK